MKYKRSITLIELMVVIVILGIISLIALPNIKNIKNKAALSAAMENKATVQKGVDKYYLEKQELPTATNPTKEIPVQINWDKLVPPYIRSKPADLDKIYYWVDYNNTVWVSDVDAPKGLVLNADGKSVSWTSVSGAEEYKIGYIEEIASIVRGKLIAGKSYKELATVTGTSYTSNIDLTGKTLVVSSISKNFESVPAGTGYTGNTLESGSGEVAINHKPVAVISMSPEQGLTTATSITWSYENSTDEDGDQITNAEWDGKQDIYSTAGAYTVKLRVQDSKGNWSDWAEKTITVINAVGIKQIACGNYHTMFLKTDGTLWGFGYNYLGQLGTTTNIGTNTPNPTPIKVMDNVKEVSAGYASTMVIKNDGTLWGFGYNQYGQLGTTVNSGTNKPNPTPIKIMDNVQSVSTGESHTVVIKNDGTLWGFGLNYHGEAGTTINNGTYTAQPIPKQITTDVKSASAGDGHTLIIKNDNTLWGIGSNYYGELGVITNNGTTNPNPTPIQIMTDVKTVSAKGSHTLVIKNDNTLWSFGYNYYGQLGTTTNIASCNKNPNPTPVQIMSNVKMASAGYAQSLVVKNDNTLWSFGNNYYGQLGTTTNIGTSNANPTPIQIETDVKGVSAGGYHNVYMKNDNTIWCFGWNIYGQLGSTINNGTQTGNPTPMQMQIALP